MRAWLVAFCVLLAGCVSLHEAPRPGATHFDSAVITLPAKRVGNMLVVEAKWDRDGPYHFLIDTGSSVTLVTPEFAKRYPAQNPIPSAIPEVRVRSSDGATTVLPSTTVSDIELGKVQFTTVPAVLYDCASLSDQLGVKIDGVLGFPLFRQTVLTLDYRRNEVVLRPTSPLMSPHVLPGSTLDFNGIDKMPIISARLGNRAFNAFIDSGSDDTISLNPQGLDAAFGFGPTTGLTVGTLTGDQTERIGRLSGTVYIGDYAVPRPVVIVTGGLSVIGGGLLKYFTVTFDQQHDRVTFYRDATDPIAIPGIRSTGLSFRKSPAYWRVVGVVPGSPADRAEVEAGDLITRINGEPVATWDLRRYEQLLANAESVIVTFLNGSQEANKELKVVELVP